MKQKPADTTASFLEEAPIRSKKKELVKETNYTVVKRNGTIVPFKRERIQRAIEAAFRDTKKIPSPTVLERDLHETIGRMTDLVVKQILLLASKGASLTVEGIQDVVEVTLMKNGHHDVARDYIIYRDSRKEARENSVLHLKIYRRDKTTPARFNPMKIAASIERAFRRARAIEEQSPDEVVGAVNLLTKKIVQEMSELANKGDILYIDMIEDRVERELMAERFYDVAKHFILYRAEKVKAAPSAPAPIHDEGTPIRQFEVATSDRSSIMITEIMLKSKLSHACRDLEGLVSVDELLETAISQYYVGMKENEVDLANIFAAKSKIEKEPAYAQVASRLLLDILYRETVGLSASDTSLDKAHRLYFKKYVKTAISQERLSPKLLDFDLETLGNAMDLKRDDLFRYLGLQTLYDRYFIHHEQRRLETPQIFWMRVAMGLALGEGDDKNARAIEFYNLLSSFLFTSATPTLFNSGTTHSQLSSCYLSTVMDDLHHIFKVVADDAQLSKWAGGIGNDWTNVRATGSHIKGTNGSSQGVIPFLKVANDTAVAVNQCFAPDTLIYTARGIVPISNVKVKDLVLGVSGTYREVLETYAYNNQKDPMVTINTEHSLTPCTVTAGHPLLAMRDEKQEWIEAGMLREGDCVAQVIPQETVGLEGFGEDDARFYGILLSCGRLSEDGSEWSVAGGPHCEFVRNYLSDRGVALRETDKIHWSVESVVAKDATTGTSVEIAGFWGRDAVYDESGAKRIAPQMMHLPKNQALAMIEGFFEPRDSAAQEGVLLEGIRYQRLRVAHTDRYLFNRVTKIQNAPISPFVYDLKVEGDESYMTTSGLAHNGGKRKGAMCAYLETWHLDIEDFLELRKNTGDERRRTHDMNTANWIPDLFMKRVKEGGQWTLFSPSDVSDLHDLYGAAFEKRYTHYEQLADSGKMKLFKRIEALQLWRKMLSMLFETGHPWITFKDPSNIRSPQDHVGVVHSSNLCTEILLNTSVEETAVCNLGSINLTTHVTEKGLDEAKLAATIRTAVRMLDNVIDINFYPTQEAAKSNLRHRPIGLGLMGFQDALYIQNISYASHEAVQFADKSMEMISYYAILASAELAKERGAYSTYKGSKWERGFLPIDTIALLEKERGCPVEVDRSQTMDWSVARAAVAKHGMRNSNVMAIAPTATIGNIIGVTPSIEPNYKHLFVKSNLSGEFTIANPYLVDKLKEAGLWDEEMIDDLKYFDGSIREIERIPAEIKTLFLTAFEIEPEWIIECGARRQKWLDMGQSLNLYLAEPSGKKLHQMYVFAWDKGLKTTYYLRSLGATQIEKSSIDINKRGLQPRWMKNKSASSNVAVVREEPKACKLGEACESCQ
ncbi:MAG: ribonucleoside-diphosphate reductase subunit alpha [Chlamydiota bacterium]|jgi:ribonucleoside-diphosphate reductase alpha chain